MLENEYERLLEEKKRKADFLFEIMGAEINSYFEDDEIIEIMYNQNQNLFIEKLGIGKINLGKNIINAMQAKQIIELTASYNEKTVNRENPILSALLPNGARFEGVLFDPVDNNPVFTIRKPSKKIFSLEDFVNMGTISKEHKEYIEKAIKDKKNILVVGGTSTGKTTFVNACLKVLDGSPERIGILEDTQELRLKVDNYIQTHTVENNTPMIKLLKNLMRMNVDRIILGELRGGEEALELLKAWNSGHEGGLSTIHANQGMQAGLLKLEQYIGEVSARNQRPAILEAVQVIVNLRKENNIRKVKEIAEVIGYDNTKEEYILRKI